MKMRTLAQLAVSVMGLGCMGPGPDPDVAIKLIPQATVVIGRGEQPGC